MTATSTDQGGGETADAPVRLVCFDLGGVLVRICRSWAEGCARAGLDVRGDTDDPAFKEKRRGIAMRHARGEIDEETWVAGVVDALGGLYDAEEILRIHHAWLVAEYADIASVVDDLHAAGLVTACLSNTNHGHWVRLIHDHAAHPPLADAEPEFPTLLRLAHRHASHLIGAGKPDAVIYETFERETGHGGPEILFFDDLPENVAAARACGWRAERIDHAAETAPQIRDHLRRHGVG